MNSPHLSKRLHALCIALVLPLAASAQVGITEKQVGDLSYTLVYPTASASLPTAFGPVTLEVAVDAAPLPGQRRLVVMSHGTGGSATTDHAQARAFVLQGMVVAQPLHRGDNFRDTKDAGPASFARRPREVSEVIDALASDAQWAPRLKLDRVGVHGMSAGGVTALSVAGAQWRTLQLIEHCQQAGEADRGFCYQGAPTPDLQEARRKSFDAVRGVPEQYLPQALTAWQGGLSPGARGAADGLNGRPDPRKDPRKDSRIAAVTLAVPVGAIFSAESLARIEIPVGVVSAGRDEMLRPRFHSEHVLKHCGRCVRLADLAGAAHFDLLWPWPREIAEVVARNTTQGGATEPGFDASERDRAQHRTAVFLKEQLQ